MNERAVSFGESGALFGIVTEPPDRRNAKECGVVLLDGGVTHRVGPNRIYVKLARRLAETGFTVLRFDFSGIGESPARRDNLPFDEYTLAETREAIDHLGQSRGLSRFVLMGISSGGEIALRGAAVIPGVVACVSMNGICVPPGSEHIYRRAFVSAAAADPRAWLRLFAGKSNFGAIARRLKRHVADVFSSVRSRQRGIDPLRDWRLLDDRGVHILMVFSGGDPTLRVFKKIHSPWIRKQELAARMRVEVVTGADHIFTLLSDQERLVSLTDDWACSVVSSLDMVTLQRSETREPKR